jgi:hypothetical protein
LAYLIIIWTKYYNFCVAGFAVLSEHSWSARSRTWRSWLDWVKFGPCDGSMPVLACLAAYHVSRAIRRKSIYHEALHRGTATEEEFYLTQGQSPG